MLDSFDKSLPTSLFDNTILYTNLSIVVFFFSMLLVFSFLFFVCFFLGSLTMPFCFLRFSFALLYAPCLLFSVLCLLFLGSLTLPFCILLRSTFSTIHHSLSYISLRRWTWTGDFKCREVKTGFYRNRWMQTGSSGTLIGWKSGQTTFVPLWDWMEGAWLRSLFSLLFLYVIFSSSGLSVFFSFFVKFAISSLHLHLYYLLPSFSLLLKNLFTIEYPSRTNFFIPVFLQ